MSNRLYAKDRIDIALKVEGTDPFDRARIIRQADVLRGEALARVIGVLWRTARAAGQRLFRPHVGGHDAELAELDDHILADIGVTRHQVPGFVAREVAAARDVANRNRHERETAHAA